MIEPVAGAPAVAVSLVTIFERLFENEFATLDGIAISARAPGGIEYLDESVALARMLADEPEAAPVVPSDAAMYRVHEALYAASPDVESVVGGWSRHLMALLMEGDVLPAATSMMRKRGVTDLRDHLIQPEALGEARLAATVSEAQATARRNEMAHILMVVSDGTVVVGAPTRIEAMAHWHNVEFAARVECMRIEEADVQASAAALVTERAPGA